MRVAVVDDERMDRRKIVGFLNRFQDELHTVFDIEEFDSSEKLLTGYKTSYDILFFDIEMDGISGMEAAKKVRQVDQNVAIMFVTNMAQYAIQGYEVDAVDYLLKPVSYGDFALKLQKALRRVASRKDRYIVLRMPEETRRISLSSLLYVEVMAHYLIYHTKEREYKVRGNMKDCEAELLPYNFTRVHKSYLVNLACIENIKNGGVVIGGETIPVGGVYRDRLIQDYMYYVRG